MNTFKEVQQLIKNWKDNYKEKSELIRKTKSNIRRGMSQGDQVWKEQWEVIKFKAEATEMLKWRELLKIRGTELWLLEAKIS